jgi:putative ABC transport system permease protein
VLKEGGHAGMNTRGAHRWTTAFLAAEFGLAVVMLAHLTTSFRSREPWPPSDRVIDTTQVLTAVVTLPREKYPSPDTRTAFYRQLHDRLRSSPAVAAVSAASVLPLYGGPQDRIDVEGRTFEEADRPSVQTVLIAPRYFEALALPVTRGRDFGDDDGAPGRANAIVNQRLVEQLFADRDPIGQRLSILPPGAPATARTWFTIVGVAPDIRQRPSAEADPVVYLPLRTMAPATATLLVRATGEPGDLASMLRREVQTLDGNLPLYRMRTLAQAIRDAGWNGRLAARLILVLTLIAVGLTTVGLYAVTAYGVSQRTQEIGLRMALGAQRRQIANVIARRAVVQLGIGFAVGIVFTMIWARLFAGTAGSLRINDPVSLLIVAGILTAVAIAGCAAPIHRATRMDAAHLMKW